MYVSKRINEYIRVQGNGNTRDALNVALARIAVLEAELRKANEMIDKYHRQLYGSDDMEDLSIEKLTQD
jgi:hypothetical protein